MFNFIELAKAAGKISFGNKSLVFGIVTKGFMFPVWGMKQVDLYLSKFSYFPDHGGGVTVDKMIGALRSDRLAMQCVPAVAPVLKTLTTLPIRKSARPVTRGGRQVFTSTLSSVALQISYQWSSSSKFMVLCTPSSHQSHLVVVTLCHIIYSSSLANSQPAWHLMRPNFQISQQISFIAHIL